MSPYFSMFILPNQVIYLLYKLSFTNSPGVGIQINNSFGSTIVLIRNIVLIAQPHSEENM